MVDDHPVKAMQVWCWLLSHMQVDDQQQKLPQEQAGVDAEKFYYDGREHGVHNSLKVLRDLCRQFGVKASGSKKQVLHRLSRTVRERETEENLALSHRQFECQIAPLMRPRNQRPDDSKVALHDLTHLPFAPWCEHCVASRAKLNEPTRRANLFKIQQKTARSLQSFRFLLHSNKYIKSIKFCHLGCMRLVVEVSCVAPVPRRGGTVSMKQMAESITTMSMHFGYEEVKLKSDD